MLTGFVREAQSYMPQIYEGITSFHHGASQQKELGEALRYVHTIKGAAAMMGLAVLSHLAYYVEETLEGLVEGQRPMDTAHATWLHHTVGQLELYLECLLVGDGSEQAVADEVERSFRQFKGLHEIAEAVVVEPETGAEASASLVDAEQPVTLPEDEPEALLDVLSDTAEMAETVSTPVFSEDDEVLELLSDLPAAEDLPAETMAEEDVPAEAAASSPLPLTPTRGALDDLIASIDETVRQVYGPAAASVARLQPSDGGQTAERYLLFTLAGGRYAVSVPHVLEIGQVPPITPVPNVPTWMRGVINLRGDILSVIDVRTFLGMEEGQPLESSRLLVVKSAGEDITTSLIVDQVTGIVPLPSASVEFSGALFEDSVAPYIHGVYEHNAQALAVFDLERFLLSPELRQFE